MSDTQIDLSWEVPGSDGGAAITGYQLQVSEDGSMFTDLDMTDDATLDYEHMGLSAGTTYHYQVAAINSVGTGAYSDPSVSATTTGGTSGSAVPAAPTSLTATAGDAQVTLSWMVPADGGEAITSYAIKIATSSGDLSSTTAAIVDVSSILNGATARPDRWTT